MKKNYLILAVLIISNFMAAQQKLSPNFQKHLRNLKNQENLMGTEKNYFEINMDSWVPTNLLSQMWTDNDWMNMAYTEFFYDSNGLLTSDISKSWAGNDWINNTRTTYTYEGNQQTIMESENWENETWVPEYKSFWTYNANGRVTNILDQMWTNNEWLTTGQDIYTYDGENCTELLMQSWVNDAWVTSHRTTYQYDAEGNNIVSISETWIMGFVIMGKEINTFEQGLLITSLRQNQEGTDWVDAGRTTYAYNENRQQTQYISEQWTGAEWVNNMKGIDTYDANGNNTEVLTQNWENNAWVDFMKLTWNYQMVTGVEDKEISIKDFKLLNNYPNPFNPSTVISYQSPVNSYITLKVYDILGNEIATLVNEEKPAGYYQVEFNATNLPSGLYLCKLQSGNRSETKKMLLLK